MSGYTTVEDFGAAHKTLQATFKTGQTKSVKWRKWQLKQLYWMLEDNEPLLIAALKQDLHRPEFEAIVYEFVGIKADVLDSLKKVDTWAQGEAPQDAGFVLGRLGKAWLRKEPLGVALIIGAWNFPLYTLLAPLVAAIAAGNCVVLKPSESASATQKALVDLVSKYFDQSAIRLCTGGPQETSYMLELKFDIIFYTGGTKVGKIVATAAAKNLTPVVLELGGQTPAIVTKSANIDLSAKRIANAKLNNAGQICLNVNHIFADPSVHDQLVDRIVYWTKEFMKDGADSISHIITDNHFSRVTQLLEKTKGKVVFNGKNDPLTRFVHPSVITGIDQSDSLMSEELFAPFVPVLKADVQTAINTITSMPHPLGLYIFSNDQREIDYILNNTTSGGATINDVMAHAGVPSAPFGGVGDSGYGSYHGKYGFEAFSHTRTVVTMPSYLEMVLSWRYIPYKIENRKIVENQMPKVDFKRGEALNDQPTGSGRSLLGTLGLTLAVLASAALGDHLSGNRIGLGRRVGDVISRVKI